jgi:hypothetical protein
MAAAGFTDSSPPDRVSIAARASEYRSRRVSSTREKLLARAVHYLRPKADKRRNLVATGSNIRRIER